MKCTWSENTLTLEFEEQEKELLIFSLEEVADTYSQNEGRLPSKFHGYWSGQLSRSRENELELGEAAADLSEARWAWKSERLSLVQRWLDEDGPLKSPGRGTLKLNNEETVQLLCILNDRRLLLTIEFDLDEEVLTSNPAVVKSSEVQQALWEINFLAGLQQYVIDVIEEL